jgi:hypothetical protein
MDMKKAMCRRVDDGHWQGHAAMGLPSLAMNITTLPTKVMSLAKPHHTNQVDTRTCLPWCQDGQGNAGRQTQGGGGA